MTRLDPNIGEKLVQAGLFRTRAFPAMLVDVYAEGLRATPRMTIARCDSE